MARDYLQLNEIAEILEAQVPNYAKHLMAAMKREAETCLCAAHSSSECCCGAWYEDHYDKPTKQECKPTT